MTKAHCEWWWLTGVGRDGSAEAEPEQPNQFDHRVHAMRAAVQEPQLVHGCDSQPVP
jgi:hypothetical protein